MSDTYTYDLFISYRRRDPMLGWVRNHFHPLISQRLTSKMPYEPRIFIDDAIETGAEWPDELGQALNSSSCLIAVLSMDYIHSAWCMAEWETMQQRMALLRAKTPSKPPRLIYPVLFDDGKFFPESIKSIKHRDLTNWNYPHQVFSDRPDYLDFDREIQGICNELVDQILDAPPWEPGWPVCIPLIAARPMLRIPRL